MSITSKRWRPRCAAVPSRWRAAACGLRHGVGKALLADYQLPQLKALYYDGLYPLTEHTITDFRLLADQLAEIRASGFATSVRRAPGASAASACRCAKAAKWWPR